MRSERRRWSLPLRLLHWAMAALILGLLVLGWVMTHVRTDLGTTFAWYLWHKSFGFAVLVLVAARIATRLLSPAPREAMPPGWQRRAAHLAHGLLYLLMVAVPVAGWMMASASPLHLPTRPFNLFTLPDLVAPNAALFRQLELVHATLAYSLLGLVVLHVAAALKHRFLDRDGVLARMGF
ncbi:MULTISPECIES: cytochrome b [Azorhizobium]|uniref:cytochrome b n=1 Tax=Azorhizobium TaxID=6 RepID=UPI0010D2565E|nr:cytochrome b [Azorhizobium sp. AG788]TDU00655.1 cytochrome b561 [Azorhizobium sp. AG788]